MEPNAFEAPGCGVWSRRIYRAERLIWEPLVYPKDKSHPKTSKKGNIKKKTESLQWTDRYRSFEPSGDRMSCVFVPEIGPLPRFPSTPRVNLFR